MHIKSHFTSQVPDETATWIVLNVNNVPKSMLSINDYVKTSSLTLKNGIMSGRMVCMLQLSVNDVLTSSVQAMWSGTDLYGSPDGVTSLQAFLYSPQSAIGTPVAWSVASTATFIAYQPPNYWTGYYLIPPSSGIVGYNLVKVNVGNAWNSSSNVTVIPVSGTYLIDVTSCLAEAYDCGNGNSGNYYMANCCNTSYQV
jgi:hypothetical protein